MTGVFIDTFIVLNLTALVILTTNLFLQDIQEQNLASMRSLHYMEKVENIFIAIVMFFFAFSTIIGWYFFGQANVKYLFGPKAVKIYSVLVVYLRIAWITCRS